MAAIKESDETPEMEADSHSTGFLKKAARLKKKRGKGKKSARKMKRKKNREM